MRGRGGGSDERKGRRFRCVEGEEGQMRGRGRRVR